MELLVVCLYAVQCEYLSPVVVEEYHGVFVSFALNRFYLFECHQKVALGCFFHFVATCAGGGDAVKLHKPIFLSVKTHLTVEDVASRLAVDL